MSVANLVTRGFGNGSLIGSISLAVTMGYTIGEEASIWTDKAIVSTLWGNKALVDTSWGDKSEVNTIWTEKT